MFTDAEISELRRQAEAAMTESFILLDTDVPGTSDGMGGTALGEPVGRAQRFAFCRIAPAGGNNEERLIAERLAAPDLLSVRLPWDTAVELTDQFEARGETFEIVAVLPVRSAAVERRILAREA